MIYILDDNFKKIDILRRYTFAQYEDKLRDVGEFTINAEITEDNLYLIDKTKHYYILFDDKVFGTIDSIEKDSDGEFDRSIIISGRLALYITDERVINKTITFSGNTAHYINTIVDSEIVTTEARRHIDFNLLYDDETRLNSICSNVDKQVTGGYVLEEILPYMEQDSLGIDIIPNVIPTTIKHGVETNIEDFDFVIMSGNDRRKGNTEGNEPVIFSQSLSNIERTSYNLDRTEYKDVAYVAGEGEDNDRKWFEVNRSGETGEGWQRRELWIDARDVQSEKDGRTLTPAEYEQLIKQRANEKFADNNLVEDYNSTITNISKYVYGVDYYKGDFVTVIDDELNVTIDAQVTGVTVSTEGNREIIDVQLSYGAVRKQNKQTREILSKIEAVDNNARYVEQKLKTLFPIGSIVLRADNINPSDIYGGTWQKIAKGRTLIGADENDTDFNTLGKTGGEKTHTLTVSELPAHNHSYNSYQSGYPSTHSGDADYMTPVNRIKGGHTSTDAYKNTEGTQTGGGSPHNNLQPYLVVNIWQRTA